VQGGELPADARPNLGAIGQAGGTNGQPGRQGEHGIVHMHNGLPVECDHRHRNPNAALEQLPGELRLLDCAADEGVRGERQVGAVQALQRRELPAAELVQPLRPRQIPQPVLAQLAKLEAPNQIPRRLRDKNLPSVTACGDARRSVHPEPEVPFVSDRGLSRVQAHAPPHLRALGPVVLCQSALRCNGGSQSRVGASEGEEERISLRVDLATVASFCRLPEDAAVAVEGVAVPVSELLEQSCRALDIREEEGDSPARQLGHSVGVRALYGVVKLKPSGPNGEILRWIGSVLGAVLLALGSSSDRYSAKVAVCRTLVVISTTSEWSEPNVVQTSSSSLARRSARIAHGRVATDGVRPLARVDASVDDGSAPALENDRALGAGRRLARNECRAKRAEQGQSEQS